MKMFLPLSVAALMLMAGQVFADDMSQELDDLRAKVASLESARMAPAAGGDGMSLTSMKKKGQIYIGGAVEMDVAVSRVDDNAGAVGSNNSNDNDVEDRTRFRTADADLDFKIMATKDSFLKIKLDLDDFANSAVNQDDLLEEIYFVWKNVRCSNWDIRLGKGEVPYGQDKDVVVTDSYHHNSGTGTYMTTTNTPGTSDVVATNGSNFSHPGELDNTFMVEGTYHWKDLIKGEIAVFQDPNARGMHEDRSDDTLFFESYAARVTFTPMENLVLKMSYINRHNDTQGDQTLGTNGNDSNEDSSAISFAFDYNFKCLPIEVFGEYQHGWVVGYDEDRSVDIAQIGVIYGLTENINIIGELEWLEASQDGGTAGLKNTETFYKGVVAGTYTFDSGISMALEYCHEVYEREGMQDGDTREADVVSFRTAWTF